MSDNFLSYCTSLDYLCHECPTCYANRTETDISQEKSDQDVVYGAGVCKSENRLYLI